ncbi:MAG: lysophospholipid acyltransferase family protein [Gemmatimonadota bacterium]|nr:lysophospholipid acyltransferase family protein [Gemmatimonadota bacterium]
MIRLFLVSIVIVPATIWYASKIAWSVYRRSADIGCRCEEAARAWASLVLRVAGVRVILEDEAVIDSSLPQVLVTNHVSWIDVLVLAAFVPGRYVFVAKKEVEKIPVFGAAVRACGHIYIDRGDKARALASLDIARKRLEEAAPTVIIFPEGTRSNTGELGPFKKGAFVLAIQTGASVVPAAMFGSREVMKRGSLLINSGIVRVHFGEPIQVGGYSMASRSKLTHRAQQVVSELQKRYKTG